MLTERRLLTIALVVLVLLAGCSGAGGGNDAGGEPEVVDAEGAATEAPPSDGNGGAAGGDAGEGQASRQAIQPQQRAIIKTGTVRLRVELFDTARSELVAAAESRGGYVASSSSTTHRSGNRTWTEGMLVLKVPSDDFDSAFAAVKAAGEVRNSESDTKDVTDRLVDIEARLENLRAQRDRLRTLYQEANDTEAVLQVGDRLSEVQGEIERLEAQKRALEGRVAYATIRVEFSEERPPKPTPTPEPGYHETPLGSAFLSSVNGVVVSLKTIAVTFAYLAPYLLTFGLPIVGATFVIWRRREIRGLFGD